MRCKYGNTHKVIKGLSRLSESMPHDIRVEIRSGIERVRVAYFAWDDVNIGKYAKFNAVYGRNCRK